MLIKKVRALKIELFALKHDYETIMVQVSPIEANFAELKLQAWLDFVVGRRQMQQQLQRQLLQLCTQHLRRCNLLLLQSALAATLQSAFESASSTLQSAVATL